jgi:phosphoribosylformylglycinamidine synthase
VLAYHDRSDGGLAVTLVEMAFAGGCGLDVDIAALGGDPRAALFAEELGAVLEVRAGDVDAVIATLGGHGLGGYVHRIGRPVSGHSITLRRGGETLLAADRFVLRAAWSDTTWRLQGLRDDSTCADEEHAARLDADDPGLTASLSFDAADDIAAPFVARGARPRVAILREQGVNGQVEMAAAFTRAGFDAVDVHTTDLIEGRDDLSAYRGVVGCGGFSFGDVLGAGEGWAKSLLYNARARAALEHFLGRADTFALGVCNGCQMFSALREIVPGAELWPRFVRNRSEQFEGRLSLVEIQDSPSLFFRGMAGSRLPVAVAHGEGRVEPTDIPHLAAIEDSGLVAARFVDGRGEVAASYPANPNGSPGGITALTTPDGRATILMPHPERVFRSALMSWHPDGWGEDSPWMRMFRNARVWVG